MESRGKGRAPEACGIRRHDGEPCRPSQSFRHCETCGISKALIYKHFGSLDALVEDAIRSRLQLLALDTLADHKGKILERVLRIASKLREEVQSQPELLDLIGWRLGNPDPRAMKVTETVRRFCAQLATRADADTEATTFFLGIITSALCDQQAVASEEIQGAGS